MNSVNRDFHNFTTYHVHFQNQHYCNDSINKHLRRDTYCCTPQPQSVVFESVELRLCVMLNSGLHCLYFWNSVLVPGKLGETDRDRFFNGVELRSCVVG